MVIWLMKYVGNKLDPDQFGGKKGHSISHYLIEMTNFILYNQDLSEPHATIASFIDYKQGFNRCQHSIFIEVLSKEYGVPGWLLRILVGYLSGRTMRVRYKGKIGEPKDIPGGAGQGAPLGMWIFLFMIDQAGPKSSPIPLGEIITKSEKRREKLEHGKQKFVDDFTILTSLNLKKDLVKDTNPNIEHPVPYRSRTGHVLPIQNPLQSQMDNIVNLSKERKMVLNPIKTKTMIFNTLNNYDVLPLISVGHGKSLEVVEEHKILGHIIRSDLKTISNTENICKRVYKRMWIIRRLKALGASQNELIEVLQQQIVSICEVGVPFWGPMITVAESNMLERCLKTGLHIIFQESYGSFENALKLANMKTLRQRRFELIAKFSKKALKSDRFKGWFVEEKPSEREIETRTKKPMRLFKNVSCRTQRYQKSSLPYMTRLLSWHPPLPAPNLYLP